jgi:hypothetical protein
MSTYREEEVQLRLFSERLARLSEPVETKVREWVTLDIESFRDSSQRNENTKLST